MTVANLIAGRQESVKRMLAYSSIAHAGYVLVGVVATMRSQPQASASVLFYLLTYTVSTAGAFGALILCGSRGAEAVSYEDLAGHRPAAPGGGARVLALPPLARGHSADGGLLRQVVRLPRGDRRRASTGSPIIAFLNSVIGAYYYLRVLVFMYMREPAAGAPIATPMRSGYVTAALLVSAILVVVLGLMPSRSLDVAIAAAATLTT